MDSPISTIVMNLHMEEFESEVIRVYLAPSKVVIRSVISSIPSVSFQFMLFAGLSWTIKLLPAPKHSAFQLVLFLSVPRYKSKQKVYSISYLHLVKYTYSTVLFSTLPECSV